MLIYLGLYSVVSRNHVARVVRWDLNASSYSPRKSGGQLASEFLNQLCGYYARMFYLRIRPSLTICAFVDTRQTVVYPKFVSNNRLSCYVRVLNRLFQTPIRTRGRFPLGRRVSMGSPRRCKIPPSGLFLSVGRPQYRRI
jgi:hypothetical protein